VLSGTGNIKVSLVDVIIQYCIEGVNGVLTICVVDLHKEADRTLNVI